MPAYRCPRCDINWPQSSAFQPCVGCGQTMATDWTKTAISVDEAADLHRRWRFEHYWREWDLERFVEELEAL